MSVRMICATLALAVFGAACGGAADATSSAQVVGGVSVAMPTHGLSSEDGVPASDLEADLVLEDNCLLLQRDASEPMLAVWPEGTTFADNAVTSGAVTIAVGEKHIFGGGEVPAGSPALEGVDLPDSCAYGGIFLVSE